MSRENIFNFLDSARVYMDSALHRSGGGPNRFVNLRRFLQRNILKHPSVIRPIHYGPIRQCRRRKLRSSSPTSSKVSSPGMTSDSPSAAEASVTSPDSDTNCDSLVPLPMQPFVGQTTVEKSHNLDSTSQDDGDLVSLAYPGAGAVVDVSAAFGGVEGSSDHGQQTSALDQYSATEKSPTTELEQYYNWSVEAYLPSCQAIPVPVTQAIADPVLVDAELPLDVCAEEQARGQNSWLGSMGTWSLRSEDDVTPFESEMTSSVSETGHAHFTDPEFSYAAALDLLGLRSDDTKEPFKTNVSGDIDYFQQEGQNQLSYTLFGDSFEEEFGDLLNYDASTGLNSGDGALSNAEEHSICTDAMDKTSYSLIHCLDSGVSFSASTTSSSNDGGSFVQAAEYYSDLTLSSHAAGCHTGQSDITGWESADINVLLSCGKYPATTVKTEPLTENQGIFRDTLNSTDDENDILEKLFSTLEEMTPTRSLNEGVAQGETTSVKHLQDADPLETPDAFTARDSQLKPKDSTRLTSLTGTTPTILASTIQQTVPTPIYSNAKPQFPKRLPPTRLQSPLELALTNTLLTSHTTQALPSSESASTNWQPLATISVHQLAPASTTQLIVQGYKPVSLFEGSSSTSDVLLTTVGVNPVMPECVFEDSADAEFFCGVTPICGADVNTPDGPCLDGLWKCEKQSKYVQSASSETTVDFAQQGTDSNGELFLLDNSVTAVNTIPVTEMQTNTPNCESLLFTIGQPLKEMGGSDVGEFPEVENNNEAVSSDSGATASNQLLSESALSDVFEGDKEDDVSLIDDNASTYDNESDYEEFDDVSESCDEKYLDDKDEASDVGEMCLKSSSNILPPFHTVFFKHAFRQVGHLLHNH